MAVPVVTCGADIVVEYATGARLVSLSATATGSPTSWRWDMIDIPPGSSANVGVNEDFDTGVATIQNPEFYIDGDVDGTYVLQCTATNIDGPSRPDLDKESAQQLVVVHLEHSRIDIPGRYQYEWDTYLDPALRRIGSGVTPFDIPVGEVLEEGDIVYAYNDGGVLKVKKALSGDADKAKVYGVAIADTLTGFVGVANTGRFRVKLAESPNAANLGAPVYVSGATPGLGTITKPEVSPLVCIGRLAEYGSTFCYVALCIPVINSSLQAAYDGGIAADYDILLDSTRDGIIIRDYGMTSTEVMFGIEGVGGTNKWFQILASGMARIEAADIRSTATTSLLLTNPTDATAGHPDQYSPSLAFRGSYYDGAAAEGVEYHWLLNTDSTQTPPNASDTLSLYVKRTTAWPTSLTKLLSLSTLYFGPDYDFSLMAFAHSAFITAESVADREGYGIAVYAGSVTSGDYRGGTIAFHAGESSINDGTGASFIVYGQSTVGGQITMEAGDGHSTGGNGGDISFKAGNAFTSGTAGYMWLEAGEVQGGATPGYARLRGGGLIGAAAGAGTLGAVYVEGGSSNTSTTYALVGGPIYITGGSVTGINTVGGTVYLRGGAATNGIYGNVVLADTGGYVDINTSSLRWGTSGTGVPTFTTRSAGTKIVLYPRLDGTHVDQGYGVDGTNIWFSIGDATDNNSFDWYAGVTKVMNLAGSGTLTVSGDLVVTGGFGRYTYTAGETVAQYEVVYAANDGGTLKLYLADADFESKSRVVGVVAVGNTAGSPAKVATAGVYPMLFSADPVAADLGKPVYLSQTAGRVTVTAPGVGTVLVRVGYLMSLATANHCEVVIHIGDEFQQ